jgi:hypothetical protein
LPQIAPLRIYFRLQFASGDACFDSLLEKSQQANKEKNNCTMNVSGNQEAGVNRTNIFRTAMIVLARIFASGCGIFKLKGY